MKKRLFISFFLIIVLICSLVALWYHNVHNKVFVTKPTVSVAPPETIPQHLTDKTPFDVLLLGYGGATHEGPYLTDTMMDVHIDPKTQKIILLSIPRDLWVTIPTNGTQGSQWKINAAYSFGLDDADYPDKQAQFKGPDGGGKLAEYAATQVTGLPIDNFVGMDFSGFVKTIDTLGGVDINVQTAFDDNGYPSEASATDNCGHSADDIKAFTATVSAAAEQENWTYFSCRYQKVHFDAGVTHMDGARALIYARSRHSAQDGTDFGRAQRQRNLLIAVEHKIFSIGFIAQAIPFMNSLKDDVRTDLDTSDIQSLLQNASTLSNYQIISLALTDKNYLMDTFSSNGQAILIPKDGQDIYTNIHTWIADVLAGKPEPVSAVVLVENGTKITGLAQTAINRLTREQIQTVPVQNGEKAVSPITTIVAYNNNLNPSDIAILEKEFNISNISYETATRSAYNVRVIVGDDYNKTRSATSSAVVY
jgi:anionic cell wall polymer biosynthesis LytR-Cps2A-Psr (LCP) family protein